MVKVGKCIYVLLPHPNPSPKEKELEDVSEDIFE
jgi:hypothetical protein